MENGMDEDKRSLQNENQQLRAEYRRLKEEQAKKPRKTGCLIAAIVCAVLMVFILSVLIAVAVPVYSTYKQRTKVSAVLAEADAAANNLTAWYRNGGSFERLALAPDGGDIMAAGEAIGVRLPAVDGLAWAIESDEGCVVIRFRWLSGCPPESCDGYLEICCEEGACIATTSVGDGNPLGYDSGPETL